MSDLRTAAQQALEAMTSFESGTNGLYEGEFAEEIAALRSALEADDGVYGARALAQAYENGWNAQAQRKPLTEGEIDSIWDSEKAFADIYAIARAIEAKHGITEEMK